MVVRSVFRSEGESPVRRRDDIGHTDRKARKAVIPERVGNGRKGRTVGTRYNYPHAEYSSTVGIDDAAPEC